MVRELYKQTITETALHVKRSQIEAAMNKKITKSGCRVYKDGFLGVAGTLGEPNQEVWSRAEDNLNERIPYPFAPERNSKRIRDLRTLSIETEEFLEEMEDILAKLRKGYPDFIFSNKIKLIETEISLVNEAGLEYINRDSSVEISLLVKHVESVSIFDTVLVYSERDLNKSQILNEFGKMLDGFRKDVSLPKQKKLPVIINSGILLSKVTESLNGETVGLGASLFSAKIGKKVFNEKVGVYQDRTAENHHCAFFDMEGVANPKDQVLLIEKGTILKPYTDKRQAAKFSYENTGAAAGGYDDIPSLGFANLSLLAGNKTLKELLEGEEGILVVMASGGDYTDDGNFSTPVQMSYLTDGERLLGRLPEFNISGNLYEIFGSNFIGVTKDKPLWNKQLPVIRMEISI
jgi:PmbA protein